MKNNVIFLLFILFSSQLFALEGQEYIAFIQAEAARFSGSHMGELEQEQLRIVADKLRASDLDLKVKVTLLMDLYENALHSPSDGAFIGERGDIVLGLIGRITSTLLELKGTDSYLLLRQRYFNILVDVVIELEAHIIPNYKPVEIMYESGVDFSEEPDAREKRLKELWVYNSKMIDEARIQEEVQYALNYFRPDDSFGSRILKKFAKFFDDSVEEQKLLKSYKGQIVQPTHAELKRIKAENKQVKPTLAGSGNTEGQLDASSTKLASIKNPEKSSQKLANNTVTSSQRDKVEIPSVQVNTPKQQEKPLEAVTNQTWLLFVVSTVLLLGVFMVFKIKKSKQ